MVPDVTRVEGRTLEYAVSDNEDAHGPDGAGSPPVWAVNIHGYFASGAMYWRESARLAHQLGWRVVNPSLPGVAGSDSLPWERMTIEQLAKEIDALLSHLRISRAVLLGHSMGGAIAVQQAVTHPGRTLGVIYRDGVATPAWRERRGLLATTVASVAPDAAFYADMLTSVALDVPDLFVGHLTSTLRSLLPDIRRNFATMGRTIPIAMMLMTLDLRPEVRLLAQGDIPILAEWGCFDRVVPAGAAEEFALCARTPVQWVPGGHSWMLARPQGQPDVLAHVPSGRRFVADVEERWRRRAGGAVSTDVAS